MFRFMTIILSCTLFSGTMFASETSGEQKSNDKKKEETIAAILKTLELKNVAAVQIDFDVAFGEVHPELRAGAALLHRQHVQRQPQG